MIGPCIGGWIYTKAVLQSISGTHTQQGAAYPVLQSKTSQLAVKCVHRAPVEATRELTEARTGFW